MAHLKEKEVLGKGGGGRSRSSGKKKGKAGETKKE